MPDAYAVCRYVRRYHEKNGYAPRRAELPDCDEAYLEKLVKNGLVQVLPLYEGGPLFGVVLTEKGSRLASARR